MRHILWRSPCLTNANSEAHVRNRHWPDLHHRLYAGILLPALAGKVLDVYGNSGYHILFVFLAAMMVIGLVILTVYKRYIKKMHAKGAL